MNSPAAETSNLVTCDVVVVGAGPAGSAAAFHAARAGLDVVMVDMADVPGTGSDTAPGPTPGTGSTGSTDNSASGSLPHGRDKTCGDGLTLALSPLWNRWARSTFSTAPRTFRASSCTVSAVPSPHPGLRAASRSAVRPSPLAPRRRSGPPCHRCRCAFYPGQGYGRHLGSSNPATQRGRWHSHGRRHPGHWRCLAGEDPRTFLCAGRRSAQRHRPQVGSAVG